MRRPQPTAVVCTALLTGAALLGAGCSAADEQSASTTSAASSSTPTSELPPLPESSTPPEAIGVSPGGVTTHVDVPADATESQFGQACHAAKLWMDGQQAEHQSLVEPYLKTLQAPGAVGPGSFGSPWAQLTPAQQAGVIMAVTGAANGECE